MSRIAKRPIKVTHGVEVSFKERQLSVKGPKGELQLIAHPAIELNIDEENIYIRPADLNGTDVTYAWDYLGFNHEYDSWCY